MTDSIPPTPQRDQPTEQVRQAHGSADQSAKAGLARNFSELARHLQAETGLDPLLQLVTRAAVAEIDGVQWAGISLIEGKHVTTRAATGDIVATIDRLQYKHDAGPCLSSLREQITIRSDDLAHEPRWPGFAAAAAQAGVRSMLSVQLFVQNEKLGALNLLSPTPAVFTEQDESTAILLASHAALAMKASTVESNLLTALESRDLIGQAKGVLMERYRINPVEAFQLLVLASQHSHTKLRDVAEHLTATGELRTG